MDDLSDVASDFATATPLPLLAWVDVAVNAVRPTDRVRLRVVRPFEVWCERRRATYDVYKTWRHQWVEGLVLGVGGVWRLRLAWGVDVDVDVARFDLVRRAVGDLPPPSWATDGLPAFVMHGP